MFKTKKFSFDDVLSYIYIVDYSKKGVRSRHNVSSKTYTPNKVITLKMSDIKENEEIKFYIIPTYSLDDQKNEKYYDANP